MDSSDTLEMVDALGSSAAEVSNGGALPDGLGWLAFCLDLHEDEWEGRHVVLWKYWWQKIHCVGLELVPNWRIH